MSENTGIQQILDNFDFAVVQSNSPETKLQSATIDQIKGLAKHLLTEAFKNFDVAKQTADAFGGEATVTLKSHGFKATYDGLTLSLAYLLAEEEVCLDR